MLVQNLLKTDTIADDHISLAEDRPRKVLSVGTEKNLDDILLTLEVAHQLMNRSHIFHDRT